MSEKGSVEFTRGIIKTWIVRSCKACKQLDVGTECPDSSCDLQPWFNSLFKWQTWNILDLATVVVKHCYDCFGSGYPLCQNHESAASQCPTFQSKMAIVNLPEIRKATLTIVANPVTGGANCQK